MPAAPFKILVGGAREKTAYAVWPAQHLDVLALTLHANPVFANTKLYDISAYAAPDAAVVVYYIFSVPIFSTWLVVFVGASTRKTSTRAGVVSIETLFKSAAWAEREASELFGVWFFFKKNNRKLITDYFFKIYPMLKWVPSIGFSEVYVSAEGYFANRPVKVFNSALS